MVTVGPFIKCKCGYFWFQISIQLSAPDFIVLPLYLSALNLLVSVLFWFNGQELIAQLLEDWKT
jgi:hypothetical protein